MTQCDIYDIITDNNPPERYFEGKNMLIQTKNFDSKTTIITNFNREKYKHEDHIHLFSEVVFILKGEMDVTVDDATETAKTGDIIIIPPLAVHGYSTKEYNEHWMCTFSNDFVLDIISEKELYASGKRHVFTPSEDLRNYILNRLIDGKRQPIPLDAEKNRFFKATLHAIFEEYFRCVKVAEERNHIHTIVAILLYMHEHSTEDVSLESIGKALGYSPKYVSKCFGYLKGLNFYRLLNSFRCEHAKKLLRKTRLRIIDIAIECGYSSERSFQRAFYQIVGQKPSDYRKGTFS